ncbi:MAG TPA: hypothetical protein VLB00_02765 [Gemmatimonadales bacterium]|nr:hypothetical protein [Gemmatimonadales bacterium]
MARNRALFALALSVVAGGRLGAQSTAPAADPSAKISAVLPADVAARVLAKIAEARARELPAAALENRALKFAARGVVPREIERSVNEHAVRLGAAKTAIETGRGKKAGDDEVEAGAEALRQGVDGAAVSQLAKESPSGRSLAVPLYVIGGLVDRGLPSDDALARVLQRLTARASDAEIQRLPGELPPQAAAGQANKPATTTTPPGASKRPGSAGPPTGIPASGGTKTLPKPPRKP